MNSYCLITGAASGIGLEFAKLLAREDHQLILVDKNMEQLMIAKQKLEHQFHSEILILNYDLSQQGVAEKIFKDLEDRLIKINILINNAGFGVFGYFHEANWEKQLELLRLTIETNTHLLRIFLKDMLTRNSGRILNVTSIAAFQPGPLMAVYYASKAYLLSLSRAISNEVKGTGVSVTTLCPGMTRTNFQSFNGNPNPKYGLFCTTAEHVAAFGYKALMKSKSIAIPCFYNRVIANIHRLLPFDTATQFSRKLQERNRENLLNPVN
ncbi:SDR family NAD(P)-dependent oxidoreductase [Draconibacterium mangrovi]|uniref:SDR family NAD(P)-dependent oxidoreductase n=1 Tax=Draconibacterium mangrovi TaxID=2697469 RepID=UPI0013D23082|nr:SDR family oxidoreductase [Draconibacterium mangrovi]